MKNNLSKVLYKNVNQLFKQVPFISYIYCALAALIVSAALLSGNISFNLTPMLEYALNILITLICYILLFWVGFPLIYAICLQNAEVSRFSNKNISFKDAFFQYYKVNKNPYRSLRTLLFAILFELIGSLIGSGIAMIISSVNNDGFFDNLVTYVQIMNENDMVVFLNQHQGFVTLYNTYRSLINSVSIFTCASYVIISLRQNEANFYLANILFADNRVNTISTPFNILFSKCVTPTVRKEHFKNDAKLNIVGYIVAVLVYFGIAISFLFIKDLEKQYIPAIALFITLLVYMPFYIRERLFDILFYTAYSDTILERLISPVKVIILQKRENYNVTKDYYPNDNQPESNDDTLSSDSKKGTIDEDGTIDFTKDDDKKDKE